MKDQNIELPAEFHSGNSVPVTQATIKRERMEEILRDAIATYRQGGNAKHQYEKAIEGSEELDPIERLRFFCSIAMRAQDWLDAEPFFDALIADRQHRGEPVAYRTWHDESRCWDYHDENTGLPAGCKKSDLKPLYDAPQPAEPVKVPSDDEDAVQPFYDLAWKTGANRRHSFEGDELVGLTFGIDDFESFCRALLARYGQPASGHSAAPMDTSPGHSGQPAASAWPVRVRDESQPIYLDGVECQYSIEKGDPWPYSETVAYVFEREAAELIAAALNAAPVAAQPHLYDGDTLTAAYMAGQDAARVPAIVAQVLAQTWEWVTAEGRPPKWKDVDDARRILGLVPTPPADGHRVNPTVEPKLDTLPVTPEEEEEAWQRMERRS